MDMYNFIASQPACPDEVRELFIRDKGRQMWRPNGLMLLNAILMGVMVGVSSFAPWLRRRPIVRYLFLAASTLFLPIVSDVTSTVDGEAQLSSSLLGDEVVSALCVAGFHFIQVLIWTVLVVLIGIDTSTIIVLDAREGRNAELPLELLIKTVWIAYLLAFTRNIGLTEKFINVTKVLNWLAVLLFLLFALTVIRIVCMYIVYYIARKSVAFGSNPRLIVGYMAKQVHEKVHERTPKLVVLGEATRKVEEQRQGYSFKKMPGDGDGDQRSTRSRFVTYLGTVFRRDRFVTLDTVFSNNHLDQPAKDLCFSFSLFKLLRCRFARYTGFEAGFMEAHKFFRREYLHSGGDYGRAFQVITDELSFIHDYYNSSLPIFFLNKYIGPLQILHSLASIVCCCIVFVLVSQMLSHLGGSFGQVECSVWCPGRAAEQNSVGYELDLRGYGYTFFDIVPIYFVVAVVVVSEARNLVSYFFSNWAKVNRICFYIKKSDRGFRTSAPGNSWTWTWNPVSSSWKEKLDQCSVLVHRPWWKVSHHFWHLLGLPDQKSIKDLSMVKNSVFKALTEGDLIIERDEEKGVLKLIRLPLSPISSPATEFRVDAFSECNGKGVADTILAWHIATSIFEVKRPELSDPEEHRTVATQLSSYCVYLVAYYPELLPPEDDDKWCRKLYKDVKKDAVLRGMRGAGYEQVVNLLAANDPNRKVHKVVRNGVKLAQKLLLVNSNTGWEALARFWTEMIMYVAPSDNLDGHVEAISCGGEFVTLLWTMLAHAGIAGRVARRVDIPDDGSDVDEAV